MSSFDSLGIGGLQRAARKEPRQEFVLAHRPLSRVLAFRNRSIDDVVNSQFVKNEILGYWKVYRQIERRCEVLDLEQQWNRLGQRA